MCFRSRKSSIFSADGVYGRDNPKTDLTIRFIEETLRDAGYRTQSTKENGVSEDLLGYNLVAEIRGVRRPDFVLELGAHYDTVPFSPGADDNGSGVAGVLAIARALANTRCSKTIRFVFYCEEETSGAGSQTHVQNILGKKDESFEGVIVFESIGYAVNKSGTQKAPIRIPLILSPPRTGNFIAVVGNARSGFIGGRFERASGKYAPDLEFYSLNRLGGFLKDAARSDHASYWKSGLPGLMLTNNANPINPNYHQPSDRIETINYDFMPQVTRATAATMLEWAEMEPDRNEGHAKGVENRLEPLPSPRSSFSNSHGKMNIMRRQSTFG